MGQIENATSADRRPEIMTEILTRELHFSVFPLMHSSMSMVYLEPKFFCEKHYLQSGVNRLGFIEVINLWWISRWLWRPTPQGIYVVFRPRITMGI